MAMKNTVEVVIGGKVYRISGFESTEYLHQVAVYINDKLAQFQTVEGYRKQNVDQKQLMLNMNLADDFFKAKRQADKLAGELEKKEREMYGIRHDLVEAQLSREKQEKELEIQREEYKKELQQVKSQRNASEQKIRELENELAEMKRRLAEAAAPSPVHNNNNRNNNYNNNNNHNKK